MDGRVAAVQQSSPAVEQDPLADPMVPLRTTARLLLVVPTATHWVEVGQVT